MKQRPVKDIVFMVIIAKYPKPEVVQQLSLNAHLADDLGLSSIDVYYLALKLENIYHRFLG